MANPDILQEADVFIERNWENIVRDIESLVAVPSVVDFATATPKSPSGEDAHDGLRAAVDLASRLGFDARDDAGEVGIADLPGTSGTVLALMCHADVVTPGSGWTGDPWIMRRRDGFLIGRGVIDDKGPLVMALYAMRFFAEKDQQLPYTLRMIIGTNEETGTMRDVAYYVEHYGSPAFMVTPDNTFPVCYGEKGMYDASLWSPELPDGAIVDFTTGDLAENAVAGEATMVVKATGRYLPKTDRISVTVGEGDLVTLHAAGVSAHASTPERGLNAIGLLADYAMKHGIATEAETAYLQSLKKVIDATDGSLAGIAAYDEHFGALTCAVGTMHRTDERLKATVDVRYPTSTSPERLSTAFDALMAECGGSAESTFVKAPFLMDPQSAIVQTMVQCYREATGLDGEPFTVGGGTYAREFPRAVSFGVEDPHDRYPSWVGGMHGADEGVAEETLRRALRTYILTIDRLMDLDLEMLDDEPMSMGEAH